MHGMTSREFFVFDLQTTGKLFENLQKFIPDLANERLEDDLVEAVDVFEQQQTIDSVAICGIECS